MTPEQIEELRQIGLAAIDAYLAKLKDEPKPWPQVGDRFHFIVSHGMIDFRDWQENEMCRNTLALGNVYRPEHRAYAERHVEAMKVQAELRTMPGVCAPPDGVLDCYCIGSNGEEFGAARINRHNIANFPLAGVWFSSSDYCESAIDTITPRRLAIFRDDYLQVPIGGQS